MKTVDIHGKKHPTYAGVLDKAHSEGLVSIKTELLQAPLTENHLMAIVKATVVLKDKTFEGIGDATPKNVNTMIAPHIVRMAETRAKGRALRDALNIAEALAEEMGENNEVKENKNPRPEKDDVKSICQEHQVEMEQRWSEKKQVYYWCHNDEDGRICFGKGYLDKVH